LEENIVVFYENKVNLTNIRKSLEIFEENLIFINIKDLKERKGTFITFFENELLSIPILYNLFQNNKFLRKLVYRFSYSQFNKNNQINYQTIKNVKRIEFKQLTEYINAEIYEKADKLSVKLFNEVREKVFVKKRFVFNDMNLYETNRLEFVEHYYRMFLNLLSIIRLIEIEKPKKIISLPSVKLDNRLIIRSVSTQRKVKVEQFIEKEPNKKLFLRYIKRKIRILMEYFWYWNIWNLFHRDLTNLKRFKINKKKNLVFAHYKNHFPPLIQVLKQTQKSKNILNIIYVPHKHIQYFKEIAKTENLKNIKIIAHFDIKYKAYCKKHIILKQLLIDVIETNSLNTLEFESIDISKLVKLSFLNLYDKLSNSLRYLENFSYVMRQVKLELVTLLSGNDAIDVLETRLAKRLFIPSLFFPHAFYGIRRDHDAFEQDYVVCAGQKDKEYFLSLGTEENKLTILGLPLFDKLYRDFARLENRANIRNKIIDKYCINPENKLILLVTTHDEDFVRERVFKSVIDLIQSRNNYYLMTKIHPIEELSYYERLLKKFPAENVIIVKNVNLHEVILASDVVIGRSSGAQIEAILLDKNVIDLSYEAISDRQLMGKFGAVVPVYAPNELPVAVQKALFDDNTANDLKIGRKKYIEYSLYKFDGNASIRVKNLIEKILNI
jgi:hypothetical protein